jgi:hypothetical protein
MQGYGGSPAAGARDTSLVDEQPLPRDGHFQQQQQRDKEGSEDEAIVAEMLLGLGGASSPALGGAVVKKRSAPPPSSPNSPLAKAARLEPPSLGE